VAQKPFFERIMTRFGPTGAILENLTLLETLISFSGQSNRISRWWRYPYDTKKGSMEGQISVDFDTGGF
jgi:hypothetical protein